MNKKKAQLISQIIKCKEEIERLKPNIEKCESIQHIYNRKIIEKAVLTKDLENFDDNFILKVVKKIVPHKERLICDYFD